VLGGTRGTLISAEVHALIFLITFHGFLDLKATNTNKMRFKNQHCILLVILFMATNQLIAQRTVETYYDLGKTKLHEVYTTTNKPPYRKHGVYKEFDAVGNLIREKNFKNDKQHGIVRIFYFMPDQFQKDCYGTLMGESNWVDGNRHGWDKSWVCNKGVVSLESEKYYEEKVLLIDKRYYTNGNAKSTIQLNGLCEEWDENGQKIAEYNLKDGVEDGMKTLWHPNGQLQSTGSMDNGKEIGLWKTYTNTGKLQSEFTAQPNASLLTSQTEYFANGNKKYHHHKTADNQYLVEEYFENGNPSSIGVKMYDNRSGELIANGLQTTYSEQGNVLFKYGMKEGVHHGTMEIFNERGEIIGGGKVVNGCRTGIHNMLYNKDWQEVFDYRLFEFKRVTEFEQDCSWDGMVKDYYKSGNIQFEGKLKSTNPDVLNGQGVFYYESGSKQKEGTYEDNKPIGELKYYDESGKLQAIEYYGKYSGLIRKLEGDQIYPSLLKDTGVRRKRLKQKVDNLFLSQSSNVFETVPIMHKKRLYNAATILLDDWESKINNPTATEDDLTQVEKIEKAVQNIMALEKQDTGSMEKELKKASTTESVIAIVNKWVTQFDLD